MLFFSAQNIQQAYKRLYYLKTYTTYRKEQARLIEYAQKNAKTFYKEVRESKMWTEAGEAELKKTITEFKGAFAINN